MNRGKITLLSFVLVFVTGISATFALTDSAAWKLVPSWSAEAAGSNLATKATIKFFNENNQEIGNWRPFPLDRVERGEEFTVTVSANSYPIKIVVRADNKFTKTERDVMKTFKLTKFVPLDPFFDNVIVSVYNEKGQLIEERRFPIGRK
jgi:hypothetical protein